jgi:hypothetical protein
MTINQCFGILKYLGNANSYLASLSPDQFNLIWPQAELRFIDARYKEYGATKEINDTISKIKVDPLTITIPGTGKYTFPVDMLHEDSVMALFNSIPQEVTQFEGNRLANKLSNSVDAPTLEFPIYVRYATYLQFYPITLGSAILTYLKRPTPSFWAYTINGTILTLSNLVGGTGYVNATYPGVFLAGGSGSGMTATVVVSGGIVTSVTVTNGGVNYLTTDTLVVNNSFLGGSGSGFSIRVATIVTTQPRPTYNPTNSVDPVFLDTDIYKIVCLILGDFGINSRDQEVMNYAMQQEKLNP